MSHWEDAQAIAILVQAGYSLESVVEYISTGDVNKLKEA